MPEPISNPCGGFVRVFVADAVAGHLRKLIARGVFDRQLPGERDLAVMLKVSRPSVRQALSCLAAEGLIDRSHGKITRVRLVAESARCDLSCTGASGEKKPRP